MLYKNCRELPYHNFNEIQVTGDLKFLVKGKKKHSQKKLEKIWLDILEEYFNLTQDYTSVKFFRDKAELRAMSNKLNVLEYLESLELFELSEDQNKKIKQILKKYRVSSITQGILETKDSLSIKIKQFNNSYNNEKKSNFDEELAYVRLKGCSINRYEITVTEWVALLNMLKKQNSPNNAKEKGFTNQSQR